MGKQMNQIPMKFCFFIKLVAFLVDGTYSLSAFAFFLNLLQFTITDPKKNFTFGFQLDDFFFP
ncbi:Uncharacterized protein APZ42_021124 [Daphnia magna]|uniref:Uncharacterized protein n=1 Tax=Daphnia magna TaxID=35525 RepID=A0A164WZB3_9CRUS|nr:Uncharacterized protein APZ42_021124 [Daphnia magna]